MANHILTKKTEEIRFRKTILPPLLNGENITAFFVPHGGRRKSLVYLSQNSANFGFKKLGKYQIYYLDNNELTDHTPEAYYFLFLKHLDPQGIYNNERKEELFFLLKQKVKGLIQKSYHLIFILGHFDQLDFPTPFFNNLKSLWEIEKTKVHFIFAVNKNIFEKESFKRYGNLKELLCQNLVYFPLFAPEDSLFVAQSFSSKYGYKLPLPKQKLAIKLSGGHPELLKACLKTFYRNPKMTDKNLISLLANQLEIRIVLEDIWESLNEEEKGWLTLVAQKARPNTQNPPENLLKLKIISRQPKKGFNLFSPLFADFVQKQKTQKPTLVLSLSGGEILGNDLPLEEKLTLQEYHLLTSFLKNPKKVISRDEIAEILWGKKSYEKYSDWAIDQIISQLRKKLAKMGVSPRNLQTIRGRGYRWIS